MKARQARLQKLRDIAKRKRAQIKKTYDEIRARNKKAREVA